MICPTAKAKFCPTGCFVAGAGQPGSRAPGGSKHIPCWADLPVASPVVRPIRWLTYKHPANGSSPPGSDPNPLRERLPNLSAMTLDELGAKMRCDKCGKRPERYYPANQTDTPGFVRSF